MIQTLRNLEENNTAGKGSEDILVKECNSTLDNTITKLLEIIFYFLTIVLFVICYYLLFRAAYERLENLKI